MIGLIDFGMTGRLTQEMRNNVISIMFALQRGDYRTIARLFYEIALKDERLDYPAIERETIEVWRSTGWAGPSRRWTWGRSSSVSRDVPRGRLPDPEHVHDAVQRQLPVPVPRQLFLPVGTRVMDPDGDLAGAGFRRTDRSPCW
ncbi:MAG: hypothetical protein R3F61_06455 [Myxococcota bacterium]